MSSFLSVAKRVSATALMLLCQGGVGVSVVEVGEEEGEASGDVSREAAVDLFGALAVFGARRPVRFGCARVPEMRR